MSNNHRAKSTKKRKKPTASLISSRPFRRARTRIKKPKFLSLSNTQLQMLSKTSNNSNNNSSRKKQLDLFQEGPGPTTLTGLLNGAVSSTTSSELSHDVAYGAEDSVNSAMLLVRTAMRRSGEREGSEEERWVSIRAEFAGGGGEEDVTSGGRGLWLRLKLDYEVVLNAWSGSGKGPFYVKAQDEEEEGERPQTVPDLRFEQYGVVPFFIFGKRLHEIFHPLLDTKCHRTHWPQVAGGMPPTGNPPLGFEGGCGAWGGEEVC
ncbi:hypothetical protein Cgig2_000405 [Carnegiea gigantea]|uniref:Uncharacterized protein n=1 Tax=Carnegiea gigantea TaxID=171969 RepID=A0A9Q1QDU1_9CARY|nr:hypothetical protein Cgig2_000405 [Carnegiea gigantea]